MNKIDSFRCGKINVFYFPIRTMRQNLFANELVRHAHEYYLFYFDAKAETSFINFFYSNLSMPSTQLVLNNKNVFNLVKSTKILDNLEI